MEWVTLGKGPGETGNGHSFVINRFSMGQCREECMTVWLSHKVWVIVLEGNVPQASYHSRDRVKRGSGSCLVILMIYTRSKP